MSSQETIIPPEILLKDCLVKVDPAYIAERAGRIKVQFHQFPDTYSVVAHASLDGFELAVATSPCVDPKSFKMALGTHYSEAKVRGLAENKLWEMAGIVLADRHREAENEPAHLFQEKYRGRFIVTPIAIPATYCPPTLPLV